jgi:hypothetical protein
MRSRDSSVDIATDHSLDDRGSFPGRDKTFFFSFLERLWCPPSVPVNK